MIPLVTQILTHLSLRDTSAMIQMRPNQLHLQMPQKEVYTKSIDKVNQ
jgi:hypothetical protein